MQCFSDGYGRQSMRWRLKSRFLAIRPLGMTKSFLGISSLGLGERDWAIKTRPWEAAVVFSTLSSVYHLAMG